MRAFQFALLALLAPSGLLHGQGRPPLDSSATIVTSGTGIITLAPERAVIHFTVQTQAQTAGAATSGNTRAVQSLLAALQAQKAPQESLQVAGVSVRANQDYQTG